VAGILFYMVDKLPDHYYPAGAGSKPFGRSHQVRPFEACTIGEWQKHLDLTPYRHSRVTFEEMAARGGMAGQWDKALLREREAKDIRTFGGAVAGYFLKAVIDRRIPIKIETEVARLMLDAGRVVGVETISSGKLKRFARRTAWSSLPGNRHRAEADFRSFSWITDQRQRSSDPSAWPCRCGFVRVRRCSRLIARRHRLPGGIESCGWNDLWLHGCATRGAAIAPLRKAATQLTIGGDR
jgi:hypothetical protein